MSAVGGGKHRGKWEKIERGAGVWALGGFVKDPEGVLSGSGAFQKDPDGARKQVPGRQEKRSRRVGNLRER